MSDDGGQSRSWHLYVGDMIEFCESVLSFTDGMNQAEFVADRRTYHATLHSLQLIGDRQPASRPMCVTHTPKSAGARLSEPETGSCTPIWASTTMWSGT